MNIGGISRDGGINIGGNGNMAVPPFNDTADGQGRQLLSVSDLDVQRDVMQFFYIQSEQDYPREVNFNIEIEKWDSSGLKIAMTFGDPMAVSTGSDLDRVMMQLNPALFVNADTGEQLPEENRVMIQEMPKQTPHGVDPDNIAALAKTTSIIVLAILIIQLIYDIYTKNSYDDLFTLFFTMQIACYLKIYSTPFPVSAEIFMDEFTKVIEFELMDPEALIQNFLPTFKLKDALFGTDSTKSNIVHKDVKASIFDDLHLYCLGVFMCLFMYGLMAFIARICPCLKNRITDRLKAIKKAVFYNLIIRLITISYIPLTMTAGVQVVMWMRGSEYQKMPEAITAFTMSAYVVILPFYIAIYLNKRRLYLYQTSIKDKVKNLYSGIHLFRDTRNLYYYPIFLMRRLVFVATPTVLHLYPFAQLQLLVFLSTAYIWFYASARPHEDRNRVRLEIFNECLIMILNYHMMLFSGFNMKKDLGFYLGYSAVTVAAIMIFANLGYMLNKDLHKCRKRANLVQKKKVQTATIIKQ